MDSAPLILVKTSFHVPLWGHEQAVWGEVADTLTGIPLIGLQLGHSLFNQRPFMRLMGLLPALCLPVLGQDPGLPKPAADLVPHIMIMSANRSIDPKLLDHTLPWPERGTPEWAELQLKLFAELVCSRIQSDCEIAKVDSIEIHFKDGVDLKKVMGEPIVKFRRNRILEISAITRKEGPNRGIWIQAAIMGLSADADGDQPKRATLTGIWEGEVEFDLKAGKDPIGTAARKAGDDLFQKLEAAGCFAPSGANPSSASSPAAPVK